ncbi:MAG: DNA mismatch repair endonuclease MutL [Eubacteriales bacterium]|nr:DNA mismatch repair endonuclease MutL [Eubacteriales bacterium]
MPQIQQLSPHVADLIAAGEVVERPASVAKELLENAIDAGASAIVTEIERGGLTYLRITDNGCGIAPQQLPTAFLRHATSKLRTADDLAAIGTLGFRGEALAAISAVSHVDIFSRERESETGAMLHLDGGVAGEVTDTGCPEGTTICVRDLFFNTPARMKFMKKDSAEGSAVTGIVTHLALSHPDISFKLLRDGAEVLHTPGDGQLLSAIYAAMGRDFARSLLPVHGCGGEISVEGFITQPLSGHGTRGKQVFFVNGRFVKSQLLAAALEEAYRNRMLKGKFPGCVLHITLPTTQVDVNVHPAKTVVKFLSDRAVFDAVYHTVLDALDHDKMPPAKKTEPSFYQKMTVTEFREKTAEVEKKPLGSYVSRPVMPVKPGVSPETPVDKPLYLHDVSVDKPKTFTAPTAKTGVSYEITPPAKKAEPITLPEPEQVTMEAKKEAPWRIVGEVLKTYIICEDEGGAMYLIDKHAAHERIRFDKLKESTEPLMAQMLLMPIAVTLSDEEYSIVLENFDTLREFGFACEDFGGSTVLLREIPADILTGDAAATVEELAQKLVLGRADPAGARDELLHTMACKSAIKAGMTTDRSEMAALVEKVQSGEIQYCPHGRPVCVRLTQYEIEKMFKRA